MTSLFSVPSIFSSPNHYHPLKCKFSARNFFFPLLHILAILPSIPFSTIPPLVPPPSTPLLTQMADLDRRHSATLHHPSSKESARKENQSEPRNSLPSPTSLRSPRSLRRTPTSSHRLSGLNVPLRKKASLHRQIRTTLAKNVFTWSHLKIFYILLDKCIDMYFYLRHHR